MLILFDLRFPGCLMSGRTSFSLRFVAFLRRPALWAVCTAPPRLPADWGPACTPPPSGQHLRLIALASAAADRPDLAPAPKPSGVSEYHQFAKKWGRTALFKNRSH